MWYGCGEVSTSSGVGVYVSIEDGDSGKIAIHTFFIRSERMDSFKRSK